MAVAVGQVKRDLDPLPALGGDGLRLGLELVGDETLPFSDSSVARNAIKRLIGEGDAA